MVYKPTNITRGGGILHVQWDNCGIYWDDGLEFMGFNWISWDFNGMYNGIYGDLMELDGIYWNQTWLAGKSP